jgi:outer membrane receptor protein involved in Fe transport
MKRWVGLELVALMTLSASALAQETPPGDAEAEEEAAPAQEPAAEEAQPAPDGTPAPSREVRTIPVAADEPEAPSKHAVTLDTIEVTASKRLKAQRDIPGSVGAIRGEELENIRAQGMEDFLKLVPGVSLTDHGSGQQIVVIRGIVSSTQPLGQQFTGVTTGIYLEEIPFNDLFLPISVPDLNPFDLERVEVLKGPQGTLFGASALAGAIRYVVNKPNYGVWQGKAQATIRQTKYGTPSEIGAVALNAPLFSDNAALRVVGLYREDPGIYDSRPNNRSGRADGGNTRDEEDIEDIRQFSGRALASWNPTDELQISAIHFQQDTEQADAVASADNREVPQRNDIPFASPFDNHFGGTNLSAVYDFGATTLLYSGNLLDKEATYLFHSEDGLLLEDQNDTAWYNTFGNVIEGNTHELRWSSAAAGDDSPWEWLVGVSRLAYQQDFWQYLPNPGPADQPPYTNPPRDPDDISQADRTASLLFATIDALGIETSLFGEATRRLGEHWEVTAGARAFETDLTADALLEGTQINALVGSDQSRNHFEIHERDINPKFSVRYLHDRNIQTYVLAAKGFQFGGVQVNPPGPVLVASAEDRGFSFGGYKSSSLWNYELGVRTEWLDRRLRFDVALFYLDWKDLQITLAIPVTPEGTVIPCTPIGAVPCGEVNATFGLVANVGRAHSEGLEAAFQVLPFTGATFTSSAAWVNAVTDELFDTDNPQGPIPPGTRLPGTPRFQWSNVLAYEHELPYFTSFTGALNIAHSHIGEMTDDLRPEESVGGYDTLDASVRLARPGAAAWWPMLNVGMQNITDVRGYTARGSREAGDYRFIRPRTTLLTLDWKY